MYWAVSSYDKLSSDFTSHGLLVSAHQTCSNSQQGLVKSKSRQTNLTLPRIM